MTVLIHKFNTFYNLISKGCFKDIFNIVKFRCYSNTYWYFVRRDLHLGLKGEIPKAKIPITLRPYKASDHQYFNNLPLDDMLLNANIPTCYVAVTEDDVPCHREWFIEPSQNIKIKAFFGHNFNKLKSDECIFERAFTRKEYRGLNIHVAVNYMLGKKALDLGYRWAVAMIDIDNIASLNAANKLETRPHKLQITKWRFFIRWTVHVEIPKKLKLKTPWLFPEIKS